MIDSITTTIAVTFCNGPTINPELQQPPVPEAYKREWVGLTIGDTAEIVKTLERNNFLVAIQNIEAKLKEKNGHA